jgi:putative Mg2+ transporter-C (MgtC) family protein
VESISAFELIGRVALAVLLGGLVGYQREARDRPAGLRTHILVTLGSAVIMVLSYYPFLGKVGADPSRIASQVVVGVGFLGAGTIIRQGNIVIGLTTAASLWAMAAVGLAVGLGLYELAIVATVLVLLVLTAFKYLEFEVRKLAYSFNLTATGEVKGLSESIASYRGHVMKVEKVKRGKKINYFLEVSFPAELDPLKLVDDFSSLDRVEEVKWETQP